MLIMPSFKKSLIVEQFQGNYLKNYTCKSFIKLIPGCGNDSTYRTTNSFFKQIDSLMNGIYRGKLDLYKIARTPEGCNRTFLYHECKSEG